MITLLFFFLKTKKFDCHGQPEKRLSITIYICVVFTFFRKKIYKEKKEFKIYVILKLVF